MTLIRGRGRGQLRSGHSHNRPPHVPVSALSYRVSCVPAHPSFEHLSGQSSLPWGLTADPKSLSQKTACLFLQSGFGPRQPRQPSKYCSFWTLSC